MAAAQSTPPLPALYSSAQFAIEIGGTGHFTSLRSIDGGHAKTEILTYHSNVKEGGILRQNGKRKYEDIKLVMGLAAGPDMWTWLDTFIRGTCERRAGALVAADKDYNEKARREFTEAIISSIDFPKFNASDKNPATITVTISPETVAYTVGNGASISGGNGGAEVARQNNIAACNFEFIYMDFSKDPIRRVTSVEAFSVKSKVIEYHHAGRTEPVKLAGKLEWPNVAFTLPEIEAKYFIDLHRKTMTGTPAPIGNATLNYFNNEKKVQGSVLFHGCRIFSVAPDKQDATNEDVRQVKVEMSVESLELKRQ